jgi:hypothetical protein
LEPQVVRVLSVVDQLDDRRPGLDAQPREQERVLAGGDLDARRAGVAACNTLLRARKSAGTIAAAATARFT